MAKIVIDSSSLSYASISDVSFRTVGVPSLSINDVHVDESVGTAVFTITLSEASDVPVTVQYSTAAGVATTAGGTTATAATSGTDFTAVGLTTVTFAPGVTSQTITINVANDGDTPGTLESFLVNWPTRATPPSPTRRAPPSSATTTPPTR
ncbi:hypothetical protein HK414_03060 [Ramlibacter terrae]|uniref:Calx-beta domain-containing protein n=1 Tax=Ramlibacter terrae TaxID=2732511 RepID=A0ABX6P0D7_9BURK|nr:hypothetical protein HK414_03060 [Ramlibacter terrae]